MITGVRLKMVTIGARLKRTITGALLPKEELIIPQANEVNKYWVVTHKRTLLAIPQTFTWVDTDGTPIVDTDGTPIEN